VQVTPVGFEVHVGVSNLKIILSPAFTVNPGERDEVTYVEKPFIRSFVGSVGVSDAETSVSIFHMDKVLNSSDPGD
jgi:hypothetical protein